MDGLPKPAAYPRRSGFSLLLAQREVPIPVDPRADGAAWRPALDIRVFLSCDLVPRSASHRTDDKLQTAHYVERRPGVCRMTSDFQADIDAIQNIAAVPTILDVVVRSTGMRFAAVARVTEDRWVTCSVVDNIDFGLKPGSELKVETTICHEIRQRNEAVVINHVSENEVYCGHPTPAMYGFQSYISMPIIRRDGSFFGTLCAIDPLPAKLENPETIGMFKLFAELIAAHLDAGDQLISTQAALKNEREVSELRDQFIAVLGHDLRNPLASIAAGAHILLRGSLDENSRKVVALMHRAVSCG